MELAGYDFRKVSAIEAWRKADGSIRTNTHYHHPAVYDADRNPEGRRLHAYGHVPFVYLEHDPLPSSPGAYVIVRSETILYVGMSGNLDQRWGPLGYEAIGVTDCFYGGSTTTCRVNSLIGSELIAGNALALWIHETPMPGPVEVAVYCAFKPPWNDAVPM